MVVSWHAFVPFRIKYGRQLVFDCAILHQIWSLVDVFLLHFASGMIASWCVLFHFALGMIVNWYKRVPICIRYGR